MPYLNTSHFSTAVLILLLQFYYLSHSSFKEHTENYPLNLRPVISSTIQAR